MKPRGQSAMLSAIALARARSVAAIVLVCIVISFLVTGPAGVPLTVPLIAAKVVAVACLAAVIVGLRKRRIPERWGHVTLTLVWIIPVAQTLLAASQFGIARVTPILLIEVLCTAMLLQTHVVVVLLLALDAACVLVIRRDGGHTGMFVSSAAIAEIFAVLFQCLFRDALVRVKLQREQQLHSQRMEATGTLAAGLAHDMNNILASITSFAELLRDQVSTQGQADLDRIVAQAQRGADLTRGLLAFSRRGQYRKQVIEMDGVLREVVPILSRTLPKSIDLRTTLAGERACIDGDAAQIHQVIVNLGLNAAAAMNGKGTLDITTARVEVAAGAIKDLPAGPYIRIAVRDDGCGMEAPTRLRVFEPFFTTKPHGRGTGLGLSTVWGIIQNHGGIVDVASEPGQGATFTIHLPIVSALPVDAPAKPELVQATQRTTILVMDDEEAVRSSTMRLLARRGYDVLGAANGEDGLRVFAEQRERIGLIVLDMGMPVMGGREFFYELRKTSSVPVLVASGYADDDEAQALTADGAALLQKPFAASALMTEVVRLLEIDAASLPPVRVDSAHESNPSRAN